MDTKIKDIILRNISKSFNGVNIINNLSIEIPAGSKVAVTGKSGAGKSTLVNMLMGFILPDNGNITLLGMDVNEENINEIRENLSWVPQELNIDVRYVRDLLLLPFGYNKNKNNKQQHPQQKQQQHQHALQKLKEQINQQQQKLEKIELELTPEQFFRFKELIRIYYNYYRAVPERHTKTPKMTDTINNDIQYHINFINDNIYN
ncbi:MAG: ATP-binding cassette domain-containing protein [Bacteroidetes bacterium]|nr:ATP-binding cassette domain-containing protein [Bacteroidota bacterium]